MSEKSKDQDPDYIYNTNSKRWVLRSGKSGQEFLRQLEKTEKTEKTEKVEEKNMDNSGDIVASVESAIESFEKLQIDAKEAKDPTSKTLNNMVSKGTLFKYVKDGQIVYTFTKQ